MKIQHKLFSPQILHFWECLHSNPEMSGLLGSVLILRTVRSLLDGSRVACGHLKSDPWLSCSMCWIFKWAFCVYYSPLFPIPPHCCIVDRRCSLLHYTSFVITGSHPFTGFQWQRNDIQHGIRWRPPKFEDMP